jgi:hypothetical protein
VISFGLVVISSLIIAFTSVGARGLMGEGQSQSDRPLDSPDTRYGLQLSVELRDTTVRLNGDTQIIVRLKNVGDKPIAIYKHLAWADADSLSLFIEVVQGKLKERDFVSEFFIAPPFPKEDFVTIQPGKFIERTRSISMRELEIEEHGEYRMIIRYLSPIPEDFAPAGLELWAREYGPLQTKPIDLKVTP